MSRKISSRNDNQQRLAQARAQQQTLDKKPRRPRRLGGTPDLTPGTGPTPYAAAPVQAPGIAPLRMHPLLALSVLTNVVLQGADRALGPAPQQPTLPAAAPTRRLLQQSPSAPTADLLVQAADQLRTAPCAAVGTLDALSHDPAINGTQASGMRDALRQQIPAAAGMPPVATQDSVAQGAYAYALARHTIGYSWYAYYSPDYGVVSNIMNRMGAVNDAQYTLACATPDTVDAARSNLTQAWGQLRSSEQSYWTSGSIGSAFNASSAYTTEGSIPNVTALQPLQANSTLASNPAFSNLFATADRLKVFDLSRNATAWAGATSRLYDDNLRFVTQPGVSLIMAPLAARINGSVGTLLTSLQVSNASFALYNQADPNVLVSLNRAHIATVGLLGDNGDVDRLWTHANTTGATNATLQSMQGARAAWQTLRAGEQLMLSNNDRRLSSPQVQAVVNASHDPARVAEGPIPLLRSALLPEVEQASAQDQGTVASIRDGASLNATTWQAVLDLDSAQPQLRDALLFSLGNTDSQYGSAGQGPQQNYMLATTLTGQPQRALFAQLTAPANSKVAYGVTWQKLLNQTGLGQDVTGQKLRWSEWVAMASDLNTAPSPYASPAQPLNSTAFTRAMQAVGLQVQKRNGLAFGSSAALGNGDVVVSYPALSALNDVQVSNSWRDATVNQLMSPWSRTGVATGYRDTGFYGNADWTGTPMSDGSSQALATLIGLRLQTGQGDAYPVAYEALVGKPPKDLQKTPAPPVTGVDDLINSLWPEAKARVRYDAGTQSWQSKPLAASWDSNQVRSAAALDGLQITSRDMLGKQHTQDLAGWVKTAVTLRCRSFGTCSDQDRRW